MQCKVGAGSQSSPWTELSYINSAVKAHFTALFVSDSRRFAEDLELNPLNYVVCCTIASAVRRHAAGNLATKESYYRYTRTG